MSETVQLPIPQVKSAEALVALCKLVVDHRISLSSADPLMVERFMTEFNKSYCNLTDDSLWEKDSIYKMLVIVTLLRKTCDDLLEILDKHTELIIDLTAGVISRDIQLGENWDGLSS
jgi:hypothetical protein